MRLAITATGAVTSVGRTAEAACAAIRAGVSRPRKLRGFRVVDEETQEDIPLTGHPIRAFTEGFQLVGRWMRLARGCMDDLLSQMNLAEAEQRVFWGKTGLLAVTSPPDDEIFLAEEGGALTQIHESYLQPLVQSLGLPVSAAHVELVARGHAATAVALRRGWEKLASSGLERLLIIAVDSCFDSLVLQQLASTNRLKTDVHPVGLMPGEAGVCLLVETEASARRRGARIQAIIDAATVAHERNHLFSEGQNMGQGLSASIQEALAASSPAEPFDGDVYSDLNGEIWRAHEWGSARVRLATRLAEPRLHLPATSLGDTGAASGALGVCLAAYDLSHGHTRHGHALILSSSTQGDVGCISLRAPRDRVSYRGTRTGDP